jgi:hypothetical protein
MVLGREGATEELIGGEGWLCGCLIRLIGEIAEAGTGMGGTSELIRTEGLKRTTFSLCPPPNPLCSAVMQHPLSRALRLDQDNDPVDNAGFPGGVNGRGVARSSETANASSRAVGSYRRSSTLCSCEASLPRDVPLLRVTR